MLFYLKMRYGLIPYSSRYSALRLVFRISMLALIGIIFAGVISYIVKAKNEVAIAKKDVETVIAFMNGSPLTANMEGGGKEYLRCNITSRTIGPLVATLAGFNQ